MSIIVNIFKIYKISIDKWTFLIYNISVMTTLTKITKPKKIISKKTKSLHAYEFNNHKKSFLLYWDL